MRAALMGTVLALVMAGCAATNPVGPATFETKLLNLYSIAEQAASQLNYIPNSQTNLANQYIATQASGFAAVASAVGTGAATAVNTTGQSIFNPIVQTQGQSQLVL